MNKKVEIIELTWLDSGGFDGVVWQFKDDDIEPPHICHSIGYLVKETDEYYAIAQSENKDQWGRVFSIPKSSVIKKVTNTNLTEKKS